MPSLPLRISRRPPSSSIRADNFGVLGAAEQVVTQRDGGDCCQFAALPAVDGEVERITAALLGVALFVQRIVLD